MHPLLARTRSRYPHSLRTAGSQVSRNESGAPGCTRNRPGASSLANKICLTTEGIYGLLLAYAAVARSLLLVSAARRPRAPSPLRPRNAHVAIPVVSNYSFEMLLVAFLLLLAGNMFRGF